MKEGSHRGSQWEPLSWKSSRCLEGATSVLSSVQNMVVVCHSAGKETHESRLANCTSLIYSTEVREVKYYQPISENIGIKKKFKDYFFKKKFSQTVVLA